MGLGGISVPSLLLIFLIVLLLFGTKKLRGLGGDLGTAIRGFKSGLTGDNDKKDEGVDAAKEEADQDSKTDKDDQAK